MQLDFDDDDSSLMDIVWRGKINPCSIIQGKAGVLLRSREHRES